MTVVLKRIAGATFAVACGALLSFSWSEHRGVSLGIESAEARVDRPSTTDCSARPSRAGGIFAPRSGPLPGQDDGYVARRPSIVARAPRPPGNFITR